MSANVFARALAAAALAATAMTALPAFAQDTVSVMQYALSHPVDNSPLPNPPALGDSVPNGIALQRVEGAPGFGYFYVDGQPVLVDLRTRAIVRIGQ